MSPFAAVGCWATTTKSPSRMPASIIESPRTRSMNSSPSPVKSAGTGSSSSTFSSASTSVPAATSPTSGTWRTGRRSMAAPGVRVPPHLDRAGLGRVAAQEAETLQRVQVAVHRRRRREADGLADLAHRRRVAALAHLELDEVEHLALAGRDLGPGRPERRALGGGRSGCRRCCLGFRHADIVHSFGTGSQTLVLDSVPTTVVRSTACPGCVRALVSHAGLTANERSRTFVRERSFPNARSEPPTTRPCRSRGAAVTIAIEPARHPLPSASRATPASSPAPTCAGGVVRPGTAAGGLAAGLLVAGAVGDRRRSSRAVS